MATFNEATGEVSPTQAQRAVLARSLAQCRMYAKLGDDGADEAVKGLTKLVAKYPVKATTPAAK